MKREELEAVVTRVAGACLLAGSKVSTAFLTAGEFARMLEEDIGRADTQPPPASPRGDEP